MSATKIGIFYDGNFLLHASNYYNYIHPQKSRLSINGLHNFIRHRVAEEENVNLKDCVISEMHYFRGRINAVEASQRGNQLYNDRVFDDILMAEGIQAHYLPLRNLQGRKEERGIDVWLALESYELAILRKLDVVVLVVSDTDYVQLFRKLIALGVKVMLLSWEFEYLNDDDVKVTTKTSHDLLQLATYPISMHDVIDCGLSQGNQLIQNLFVNSAPSEANVVAAGLNSDLEMSEVMSIKNGYGFIKYPNNNLFFHYLDVIGDFNEIQPGDRVTFTIAKNANDQDVAKNVRKLTQDEVDAVMANEISDENFDLDEEPIESENLHVESNDEI